MKWYKFLKYFFIPFSALSGLANFSSLMKAGGIAYHLPEIALAVGLFYHFGASLIGMREMRPTGPRHLLNGCIVICGYGIFLLNIPLLAGGILHWYYNREYFKNRQHLFHDN